MLNNINSNTPKREKKAVGVVTFLMAGAIIGSLIAGNVTSAKATSTVDEAKEDMAAIYEMEKDNPADTFIPEDITEEAVLEVELSNLEANAENDGREKADLVEEAEAISQLNQTDNKDWDGKVEIWVDGQGWVDVDTLSAEEIERLTSSTANTTDIVPANTTINIDTKKNGHYEEVWVED